MKRLYSRQYAQSSSILNPAREYVPAARTDIRATFERVQAEQRAQREWRRLDRIVREQFDLPLAP